MLRRHLLAAAPFAFTATAAQAAGGGEEKVKEEPYVNISPIALPIAVDGRLIMRLRACFERAADAGIISYEHCEEFCSCITEYESGSIEMDITDLEKEIMAMLKEVTE